jgi:NitT/TauT family transport system substrate-binding protein
MQLMKLKVALLPVLAALVVLPLLAGCPNNPTNSSNPATGAHSGKPLSIAYSDWPGWLVWEIAVQKNFFKDAGVDVKMEWFDYGPSIEAYEAGKVDAILIACGDSLPTGAHGKPSTIIVLTDYSNGNDMIIGKKGVESIKDLKGKKVALERTLVEHLLLDKALKDNGLSESDVTLVDVKTDETPQTLGSGNVDAVGAWYPISGRTLNSVTGSKPLYTSANAPGLIYDALQVTPESLAAHRDEWKKVIGVWFRCLEFLNDPKTHDEAVKIMVARINAKPEDLEKNLKGTALLGKEENLKRIEKGETLDTVYGSLKNANAFYLDRKVYDKSQDPATYIDSSLVMEVVGKK